MAAGERLQLGIDLGKILKNYLIIDRDLAGQATRRRFEKWKKAISPITAQFIGFPFKSLLGCHFSVNNEK
jgi:hypothetical protein